MPEMQTTEEVQKRAAGWEQANLKQLIVFHVGNEVFGLPIDDVREIIRTGKITPIPDSPAFVSGLINVRGDIIPTIDLRTCFALPEEETEKNLHIVVTRNQPSVYGLLVDEVTEVLRIPEGEVKKPPKILTAIHEEYISGVVTREDQLTIVLDLNKVLSDEEIHKLDETTRRHMMSEDREEKTKDGEKKKEKRRKKTEEKQKTENDEEKKP